MSQRVAQPNHRQVHGLADSPQSDARPVLDERMCPTCGQSLPWDACFCPYDGCALSEQGGLASLQNSGTRDVVVSHDFHDSLIGAIIDERYEVLQLLGEGGMGCVYRVRHRVLGRCFALKALRPELSRDFALAERFVQEARAAAAITHPNVVSITDFGILDRGEPYFVMELLEGRTLSSELRCRGALEPEVVAKIARSVASALGAAHEVGVVHRDLKPDNVVLLGEQTVPTSLKVLDFGLAKVLGASRLTRDDIVYGTPQYMSPEQASGEPIDPRVDVYALGILMYEMLTGKVPFEADSYMGVLTKQLYAEPVSPTTLCSNLSRVAGFEDIILCCLKKNRQERFSSMRDVVQALDNLPIDVCGDELGDSARTRSLVPSRPQFDSRVVRRKVRGLRWWGYALIGSMALGAALWLLFDQISGRNVSNSDDAIATGAAAVYRDGRLVKQQARGAQDAVGRGHQPFERSVQSRPVNRPSRTGTQKADGNPVRTDAIGRDSGGKDLGGKDPAARDLGGKENDRSTGRLPSSKVNRQTTLPNGVASAGTLDSSGMTDPWAK